MTPDALEGQLPRIRALLGLASSPGGEQVEAVPAADEIGAVAGVAFEWDAPPHRATVYLMPTTGALDSGEATLHADLDHPTVATASTVNGMLLLWATALAGDAAGGAALKALVQRFAGRE